MGLFFYSLTDKGRVNLCEVAYRLGIDIKKLEAELDQKDKEVGKDELPVGKPLIEPLSELEVIMRQKPKGRYKVV